MKLIIASALLATGYSVPQLAQSQVSRVIKRRLGGPHEFDITNVVSSSSLQSNELGDSNVFGYNPNTKNFDAGILVKGQDAPGRHLAGECTDFIECENGNTKDDPEISCEEACGEDCCVGENACESFTGNVCKDAKSCIGIKACYNANVEEIVSGCNGESACGYAGFDGFVGSIYESCTDFKSCFAAAYYGNITSIVNSCEENNACSYAAAGYKEDGIIGGVIGEITDSCIGESACYRAAYNDGKIESIISSCIEDDACSYAASSNGTIEVLEDSCVGYYSCSSASAYDGLIGNIRESCIGRSACEYAAYTYGAIGVIADACNAEYSCTRAASDTGFIGAIENACNAAMACDSAGQGRSIFALKTCCNANNSCVSIDENNVTETCNATDLSPAPTTKPPGVIAQFIVDKTHTYIDAANIPDRKSVV